MRVLTLVFLLQIFVSFSFGQANNGKIKGLVKDATGKSLDAVTVSLLKGADSSVSSVTTSDKAGTFLFENVPFGKYILSVTHVGFSALYKPLELNASHASLALRDISLASSETSLGQVTVVGKRPLIENKIDKTVVNVDASPSNGGLNALEVLEKSPGVTVDNDGNVSLKGKAGVIIMIDGKPTYLNAADLANYLKNMQSNQIDQIEIMSQPPAKYDAAGNSGVINLITKKNRNNGFNGSITTNAIVAIYFKNTNNFTFNWRQGRTNIYGNYGYAYWEGFNEGNLTKSLRENSNELFNRYTEQNTFGRYSDRGHSWRAGIDFFADKKTTIGFSVNGNYDKEQFTSKSRADFYDSLHNFVQYNIAESQNKTPQLRVGFNGNFLRKLDEKGSEISVDADYIYYNTKGTAYSNNYLYNADKVPSEDPYLLNGLLPSKIDIYSLKSDYKKIVSPDITLEAGIKTSFVKTDNDAAYTLYNSANQKWETDTSISNHFIYTENINAAYVNWSQKIKKFSMQLGLRTEQTNATGDQTVKSVSFKKNYIQLFPTAYFTYKPNDNNTFGLSFGRRIERPDYQSLNPFRWQLDRYTYQVGNPNLQPQFSNNIEVSWNYKGQLNISANYTKTTDIISDVLITVREPLDSNYTTYQTSQNVASLRNIGLSINYSKQLTKSWMMNAFFNVYNNHYLGVIDSTNIDVSFVSFNANFNTQYSFKKGWVAELSGFYYAKDYISGALLADGRGMFSLSGSKQVLSGKGSIKLSLRDPFYLMSFTGNTNLNKGITRSHFVWDNRRIILTLVYRFGKNNNQPQGRRANVDETNRVGGHGQQ
ncbi:MAG: TonB-dependent receptor [Bacteroidetes bacterium]|nr:TonB-dependent receptor [Bacteroidota bacterium]